MLRFTFVSILMVLTSFLQAIEVQIKWPIQVQLGYSQYSYCLNGHYSESDVESRWRDGEHRDGVNHVIEFDYSGEQERSNLTKFPKSVQEFLANGVFPVSANLTEVSVTLFPQTIVLKSVPNTVSSEGGMGARGHEDRGPGISSSIRFTAMATVAPIVSGLTGEKINPLVQIVEVPLKLSSEFLLKKVEKNLLGTWSNEPTFEKLLVDSVRCPIRINK